MIGDQLQAAMFTALEAANICGKRIFDRVSEDATFPYITIGISQVLDDGGSGSHCTGGWEVFEDVHVWSRPPTGSKGELKTISAAVVAALLGIEAVEGFRVIVCQMTNARAFRDPDGLTEHGVITMRFLLDPAN